VANTQAFVKRWKYDNLTECPVGWVALVVVVAVVVVAVVGIIYVIGAFS